MIRKYLAAAFGLALAVGCSGSSTLKENELDEPNAGAGGSSGSEAQAGAANQAGQGGTAQAGSPGVGGGCTKLCVPTASFVIASPVTAEELRSGQLKACRNGEECFEGEVPPLSGGNTVSFEGAQTWEGPTAFSEDDWKTLRVSWSGIGATPPYASGDRFTLELEREDSTVTLIDRVVEFETVQDCAGTCLNAHIDLSGELDGEAGASGEAGAGGEAGGGGQGGAR